MTELSTPFCRIAESKELPMQTCEEVAFGSISRIEQFNEEEIKKYDAKIDTNNFFHTH